MRQIIYHFCSRWIYFEFVKFHEKLFKAQKIQREFNENQNEFKVEDELQKLQEQVSSTTFKQTKELGNKLNEQENKLVNISKQTKEVVNKLEVLEKNSETTSEQSKELRNKLEELEKQLVTDSKQTKKLENKLEELERNMKSKLRNYSHSNEGAWW